MKNKKLKILALVAIVAVVASIGVWYVSQERLETTQKAETRMITDMAGRTVEIPATVERIVSVNPMATQAVFVVHGQDKLVGITLKMGRKKMEEIYPKIKNMPAPMGPEGLNIEEILSLKPDVVLSKAGTKWTGYNKKMEEAGIPLVCIYPESPELLAESVRLIGDVLGKEKEAEDFASFYDKKMEYIRSNTQIPEDEKMKVYVAVPDKLTTAGGDWYQSYLIEDAGGINVAGSLMGGWKTVSIEQILRWNPDVIVVVSYCSDSVDDILSNPRWQQINAVKNCRVYRIPRYIEAWDMPVPESILGTMWLSNKLYPEEVHFNMAEEMKTFYSKFYNYTITDEEIAQILR
ncbi:MAG: Cobalamin-binding protein precursor [Candidatus Methanolliviera sp. GoM_oil]|nr:MAG: Cobalamin-binding protein precursor [Candidatus Methanolliviera sp. GoM_oil]